MVVHHEHLSKYLAELGCKGGQTTPEKLTPEQRKKSARKAARVGWAKERKNSMSGSLLVLLGSGCLGFIMMWVSLEFTLQFQTNSDQMFPAVAIN